MEAKKINYKKLSEIEHTISGIIKYFNGYPKKLNSKDFNQLILETSELQLLQKELNLTNADLKYCLVKGTVPYPKYCVVCGKQVHIKEHDLMKGYPSTCCRECSFKDPERNKKILALNLDPENIKRKVAKTKQTCLKKYGVASAFQVKEIKDKIVKTNIEKYGAANPFASDIIKEKIKATNLERYGVEQVLANKEIKAKAEQAMIDKYGVKNIFHNVDFIKSRLLEKYGVENIMKLPSIVKTLEENILKKYGVANISELNETKLQKLKTHCHTIYTLIVKRCKEEFEDKITPLFSEEDYFNLRRSDKYKYASTNLMWKCNVCGEVFEDYYANGEIPICPKCNPGVKRGLQNEILNYIQNIYKGNIVTEDRSIINPLTSNRD